MDYTIHLPSKPAVVSEDAFQGVYQIDSLYPGYGHTLGNSLRRIILSSLPGAAITSVKIEGVAHEFSTIEGVQEDVILILLNLKKVRLRLLTDEPQTLTLSIKGEKEITAGDIEAPGQVEILNPKQVIAHTTNKKAELKMELRVEKGLGYLRKEDVEKEKTDIGTIALDAVFTPVRRVNYEVENMRVGDRTDFNRLRMVIETDGTITPKEALEQSITTMINQLKAIVGFKEEETESLLQNRKEELSPAEDSLQSSKEAPSASDTEEIKEFMKTRIESLGFSTRTENALINANIRTVGGLARKREEDILNIDGLGEKGLQEIKRSLGNYGITLK